MKFCNLGRKVSALVFTLALGAGLTSCGSGTIGYLYVLGQLTSSGTYGQVSGFKIDDRTGNLTNMVGSPYSTGGINPANAVVFPGGRFLFVLNKGVTTAPSAPGQCPTNTGGSISEFLIGGDGVLSFQQTYFSQGISPVWISSDSTGRFLYILDQAALIPGPGGTSTCKIDSAVTGPNVGKPDGAITVMQLSTDTGRLQVVQNQQVFDNAGNRLNFFPVGVTPTMFRTIGSYVYTLDTNDQSIFVYQTGGTNGQLTVAQSTVQPTGGTNVTSIGSDPGGRYVYLTDQSPCLNSTTPSCIRIFTVGSNGALASLTAGPQPGDANATNPVWTLVSQNSKFLYVVNQGNNLNPSIVSSNITAYTINSSTGQLQELADSPYPSGSKPVCMVEDPSDQYVYVSNFADSTVTGYVINANTGQLSPLSRTTVFPISGQASCLVVSQFTS